MKLRYQCTLIAAIAFALARTLNAEADGVEDQARTRQINALATDNAKPGNSRHDFRVGVGLR